jgi:hypothetical protein
MKKIIRKILIFIQILINFNKFINKFQIIKKKSEYYKFFFNSNIQIIKLKIIQYNVQKNKHKIMKIFLKNIINQNIVMLVLQKL